jgi:FKBP-type peptidyl-prolyl cis-trans isomerase FkpA
MRRIALALLLALACSGGDGSSEPTDAGQTAAPAAEQASGAEPAIGERITTPSGLVIIHERIGTGEHPKPTDRVKVHYHGTFPDGTVFDSSVQRGQPAVFPLARVIPCWTEGLQLIRVGGKAKLECPPQIAYGARGAPPRIPPNATLFFEVELLGIQ